ncbi:dienelactone hydrolase family protein [Leekyejoonella antrihumi]|uniref:Dienelactone hydrolase family protein n=1 Tax=Leekyejoonella antrihumi TaxID=1660198 RepID=A0A563E6Y5_9MICO|nr:dienelactone hydrolase family protein [Leekyejoonella antrihumi]TWP38023.1 dienelactone hydrolase family protein [Leekyejoonella antrihumi]
MRSETTSITTPDGVADAYLSRPDNGDHPGVLLFIDAIGLRPRIEEMADRIASWGYVVLTPNLFYRTGKAADLAPKTDLSVPENREAFFADAMTRVKSLSTEQAMSDAGAYLDALQAQPGVTGRAVGTTGYCMGGRLSFVTAATYPDKVVAAGGFHAGGLVTDGPDSPHLLADKVSAELVFGHADNDRSMPAAAIEELEAALDRAGVTYTSEVYAGAAHGYTMADTATYNEDATEKHFHVLEDLLKRRLG